MHDTIISKRKYFLSGVAAVAIIAFSSSVSLAANPKVWDGFYVGGHIGWGEADFRMTDLHDGDGSTNTDPSGVLGGAQVGYNRQLDSFMLGLEADVSIANLDERKSFAPANSARHARHELEYLASLRARIGLPMDRLLLYVTGGLAYTKAKYVATSPDDTRNSGKHSKLGGVVGLGAEYMLPGQNLSVKVEGLRYFFNDNDTFEGSDNPSGSSKFKDALVLRIGLNFKF